MQVLIASIKIPNRVRKDLGDVQSLMDSLQRCGQLNPITVTRDMVLIAGHRRFEAASRLGWRMIDASVVDGIDEIRRLEIELEENIHRKDFSPEELLDGVRRLDDLRRPRPLKRIGRALRKAFGALAFWRRIGRGREQPEAPASAPARLALQAEGDRDEPAGRNATAAAEPAPPPAAAAETATSGPSTSGPQKPRAAGDDEPVLGI